MQQGDGNFPPRDAEGATYLETQGARCVLLHLRSSGHLIAAEARATAAVSASAWSWGYRRRRRLLAR